MKLLTSLLFFHYIAALSTTDIDPIPNITLSNLTSSGGACLNGSVNTVLTTINSTTGVYQMKHILEAFTPWTEPDRPALEQRKNCKVNVDIGIPSGWRAQANKAGSNVSGFLRLADNETTAHFWAAYSFASNPSSVSSSSLFFVGPMTGRFTRHADQEGKVALSSCNGDTLQTAYWIRAHSGSSTPPGYAGPDPEPDKLEWVIISGVEILRC